MPTLLLPTVLAPLLRTHRTLMEQVLEATYSENAVQQRLDILEMLAQANQLTLAELLSHTLERDQLSNRFAAILRNRAPELLPLDSTPDLPSVDENAALDDTVNLQKMGIFTTQAHARRCRIAISPRPGQRAKVRGSGLLVGRRLVLTAAHVIDEALNPGPDLGKPLIVVTDVNHQDYDAWPVFVSPVHDEDRNGRMAPPEAYETHADVALLRLIKPIGRDHKYGHFSLNHAHPSGPGTWNLILLHYPAGQDIGAELSAYSRQTGTDMYLPHSAGSAGGSSGGAGFCSNFGFVGHHQAGVPGRHAGRIVPFERYDHNADFRAALAADTQPDYLWSTDESPDGHFIIGRSRFFDGLSAIFEGTAPALRGIWVKRMDPALSTAGLSFSFDMLTAYLAAHDRNDAAHRVSTDLVSGDLLGEINAALIGTGTPLLASPGVGPDDTTRAATAAERAEILAARLQSKALSQGAPIWLCFDNPPNGLTQSTRLQLEHLIAQCLTKPDLRLLLAGFETFSIRDRIYESVAKARLQDAPGLLIEEIGEFTEEDVRDTVASMVKSLGLPWNEGVIQTAVTVALTGIDEIAGRYPARAAQLVAKALKAQVRVLGVGQS
ncbi:trypsin-like serine peptidase [Roseovarius aestuariivivens]|uniref:trypsin-like serine peptidase n=1 Tax=Roseovarius aestuariivivens TaxID=1888910 RepID=UPI00108092B5|nr:trypsin-like peptidase domain-containing protein [Roseovarius aestuariivivens]